MSAAEIGAEYHRNGRLSDKAMLSLRALLEESDDPYAAITLAGDVGAFRLADDIVPHLASADSMVRWNAVGVLFTRFREVRFSRLCCELLDKESDTMVRGIALMGAGELLPIIEDQDLRQRLASKLLQTLDGDSEFPEMRDSAYLGIEAAVGLAPTERSPAGRTLDPKTDFRKAVLEEFRRIYSPSP
jgi:hypothetical protein